MFHIFPSTLSPYVRLVPGAIGSVRGTLQRFLGWSPLLARPHLVVQMLSSFLRPHVGSVASSVTSRRRVVLIRSCCGKSGVNRT